jgi:hypothetical protein
MIYESHCLELHNVMGRNSHLLVQEPIAFSYSTHLYSSVIKRHGNTDAHPHTYKVRKRHRAQHTHLHPFTAQEHGQSVSERQAHTHTHSVSASARWDPLRKHPPSKCQSSPCCCCCCCCCCCSNCQAPLVLAPWSLLLHQSLSNISITPFISCISAEEPSTSAWEPGSDACPGTIEGPASASASAPASAASALASAASFQLELWPACVGLRGPGRKSVMFPLPCS